MAGPSCFHGGTVGWCLLCLTVRNWGIKFKVGSALHPTTQTQWVQTASQFPCKSDSVYIYMHIKAVCQHFSGFKQGHFSTTDITWIKSDELLSKLKPHLLPRPPPHCFLFVFLLFITKHWFRFHFRCVLSSWSLCDSYPDACSCCRGNISFLFTSRQGTL